MQKERKSQCLGSVLHRSSCECWELINRNTTIAICLTYVFHLSLRFILPMTRSVNTNRSIFLCSSISAAQHGDLESLCSWISLSMHQNTVLQLYMLLRGKLFNNYAVCCHHFNNQRSTCIGVGFEFSVCLVANTTAVKCYGGRISIQQFWSQPQGTCGPNVTSAVIHIAKQFFFKPVSPSA